MAPTCDHRSGNRVFRENTVATTFSAHFDELYAYDLINRLSRMDRGTLTEMQDAITNNTFAQCWTLDSNGNWSGYREDDSGSGTWSLNQSRTANTVNEITDITELAGATWVTPEYDAAGNMTTIPSVADPTVAQICKYDAWNRLVNVAQGSNTVSTYSYDAAKRQSIQEIYTSGTVSQTRHFYYTDPSKWQVIEERVSMSPDSASAERQFVWGLRYIDDLIVRDRDTSGDGTLDERLYATQDANWNVTALTYASGEAQERYAYSAYGVATILTSTFGIRDSSSLGWETRYSGYRYDPTTGVLIARNRVYHPLFGTWLQRDPLQRLSAENLYQYSYSNPLNTTDPSGTEPVEVGVGAVALAALTACLIHSGINLVAQGFFGFLGRFVVPPGLNLSTACNILTGCLHGICLAAFLPIVGPGWSIAVCTAVGYFVCEACSNAAAAPRCFARPALWVDVGLAILGLC